MTGHWRIGVVVAMIAVTCRAQQDRRTLVKDLMADYDRRIRPSPNGSTPVSMYLTFAPVMLLGVDEKNHIMETRSFLRYDWVDSELIWNPLDYGNTSVIHLPFDSIWIPDVILINDADVASSLKANVKTNAVVMHNGSVSLRTEILFKSSCRLDISEFELHSMVAEAREIRFARSPNPFARIFFYIHIKRRPLFYVFNMILPCFLITLIALTGFCIPSDSGEKATVGVTTLASMTAFLILTTNLMPPTSDLPLIGIYYFFSIGIVSLATAMTVFSLNIHHSRRRREAFPGWARFVFFKVLSKLVCCPSERKQYDFKTMSHIADTLSEDEPHNVSADTLSTEDNLHSYPAMNPNTQSSHLTDIITTISRSLLKYRLRLEAEEEIQLVRSQWQGVAMIVDRFLLLVFVMLTVSMSLALILKSCFSESDQIKWTTS